MPDQVDCGECGGRYDSQEHAFCPRCGSTKSRGPIPEAPALADRLDPRRRRVRMVGILLLITGSLFAVGLGNEVVAPTDLDPAVAQVLLEVLADTPAFAEGPGGAFVLTVTDNGTPVQGATVEVRHWNGTLFTNHTTDAAGQASAGLPGKFSNVTVTSAGSDWYRHVYAPAGETVAITLDQQEVPAGEVVWDQHPPTQPLRVLAGSMMLFALLVAVGGVAAIRQRAYPLALAGTLLASTFTLLVFLTMPNLFTGINAAALAAATVVVVRARPLFSKPPAP